MTGEEIDALRSSNDPDWSTLIASVWTLPREARVEQGWTYQAGRFDTINVPNLL